MNKFFLSLIGYLAICYMTTPTNSKLLAGGKDMDSMIELTGSYYEIGKGWGEAFSGKMEKVVELELGIIAAFYGTDIDGVIELSRKYLHPAENFDSDFITVLEGFAEGAGIEFDALFAIRTALEVLFYSGRPQGMCTSFALTGAATKDGKTIIGQNIDWHPSLPIALLRIDWPNGVQQITLSMAGIWEYSLSAHPSAAPYGVVATLTATPNENLDNPTVPVSILMNKASRQESVEQAVSVFSAAQTNLASFLLASGDGLLSGIELGLRSVELLHPERDILVHTNHYTSDKLKPQDIFLPYVPDSLLRYARMTTLINQNYGRITVDHLKRFLADHNNHPKGICTHVDPASQLPPSATLASVIMVPESKTMYVAIGNPCETGYTRYELDPI